MDCDDLERGAEMAFTAATPAYRRRRGAVMIVALPVAFVLGLVMIVVGWNLEDAAAVVVWLGVAIAVLSLLILATVARAGYKKDLALREGGTVELLTVGSTRVTGYSKWDHWELICEMHIRLDSGYTTRGSYGATVQDKRFRRTRRYYTPDGTERVGPRPSDGLLAHFDEWFRAGASLRCEYNTADPDRVVVFPFAAQGDRIRYGEFASVGSDYVWFHSTT